MQNWKFLLLGVTGDLSKKKILPALSQFAEINKDKVSIDFIGYSRSEANKEEIGSILNSKNISQTNFGSIDFVQGEYSDPTFFSNLLNSNSSQKVVVYFAVPPSVFLDLLETFCPFNSKNLEIIIEKPFGRNLEEAKKIIKKIKDCKLEKNVHFCDHYLFKSGTNFENKILEKFDFLKDQKLQSIDVDILESVDVKGRGGFYDQTGALMDMFPAHMISLLKIVEVFSSQFKIKDLSEFNVERLKLGQYDNYLNDLEIEESNTDTYFDVGISNNNLQINLVSGKSLDKKLTNIKINFVENQTLEIIVNPKPALLLYKDNLLVEEIKVSDENKLDHTTMFENILMNNFEKFYTYENAIIGWELYNKVIEYKSSHNTELNSYKSSAT